MWVKTQDGDSLLKVDYFTIVENRHMVDIIGFTATGLVRLGCYRTKERATQVLNEIASALSPYRSLNHAKTRDSVREAADYSFPDLSFFTMPKD